ncbi:WD40 repeat domain-containing protein [Runella salmonicolor]|uniref:WD40 repeat domain-containing protein n=1 Tax=Runella salmonicolor TaxID=2950278 RepID=A0ABT1FPL1_9BACT|nr:WD40 repeat domain-containing protein [Runella salmonicolor]MCP1383435.1 WD40 repeat domain-containing protein [Runella salmonicolor]
MTKIQVQKIDTFSGHRDCVYALQPALQPHHFFSAAGDGLVVHWDLTRPDWGEVVAQVPASVYSMAYDSVQNQLWVGQNYEGIQRIAPYEKQVVSSIRLTSATIFDIQFFENQAFIGLSDGVVLIMDKDQFAVRKHLKASNQSARCISINPHTRELAVGYSDHTIRIFGLDDHVLHYTLVSHTNSVFTLQYSPDGRFLISGSRDAHLKVWDVSEKYSLHQDVVAHLFAINHVVYSPDAQWLATCSMDKSIKVWDATTFKLLKVIDRARHAGHGTSINKLLWSTFDNQLVSASDDKRISVWDIKSL